jgi:alanine racemase
MARPTQARFFSEHLLHNIQLIRGLHPRCKMVGMVKANAYGHGMVDVAHRIASSVDYLGVSNIDEALVLRHAGIETLIILMEGIFCPSEFTLADQHNLNVVFQNMEQWTWFKKSPIRLEAWIKVDTGMGRLGFRLEEASKVYDEMVDHPDLVDTPGIMSHFACADIPGHPLNRTQHEAFHAFLEGKKGLRSLENSAAALLPFGALSDVIRVGLGMYGCSPFPHQKGSDLGLKPVMSLESQLIRVFQASPGQSLGYGGRYICPELMPVGVVALGYGDGYPLSAQDGTPILVEGKLCALAGRVSMDMITVDLRGYPQAKVGDRVVLWGPELSVERIAPHTQEHVWSLLTGLQARIHRRWV